MIENKYLVNLIIKCDELPKYAFLIPLLNKKTMKFDDIYDPKKIIYNVEELEKFNKEQIENIIIEIYNNK